MAVSEAIVNLLRVNHRPDDFNIEQEHKVFTSKDCGSNTNHNQCALDLPVERGDADHEPLPGGEVFYRRQPKSGRRSCMCIAAFDPHPAHPAPVVRAPA